MLFGGLESVVRNINHKSQNLKFFEVGNTYIYNKEKWSEESPIKAYSQEAHMSLFITGKRVEGSWAHADEQSNIYELKAVVENVLRRVGMPQNNVVIKHSDNNIFSKGVNYETRAGKVLVELGILSLKLKKAFDIEQDVFYADIHWDNLMKAVKKVNLTYTCLLYTSSGIGPATSAPVRVADSTIFAAAVSSVRCSYAFKRIRIFLFAIFFSFSSI